MRKLRKFFALTTQQRHIFLRALVMLPRVKHQIKIQGVTRTQAALATTRSVSVPHTPDLSDTYTISMLVRKAAWYSPFEINCLVRSMTLWRILRDQGIHTDLRIGVRHDNGSFDAHAWLEYQGTVLNDSPDVHERYAAFDRPISLAFSESG